MTNEPWGDPDTIHEVLAKCDTWAIVGLGDNPSRAAYGVALVPVGVQEVDR